MLLEALKRLNKMSLWEKVGIFDVFLICMNSGKIGLESLKKKKREKVEGSRQ